MLNIKKISKIDNPLARLIRKKNRTNCQYQEWERHITTDSTDMKRIKDN